MPLSSVPLPLAMSTGLMMCTSTTYSTRPRELRGASLMYVMPALSGSEGSISPWARLLFVLQKACVQAEREVASAGLSVPVVAIHR